MVYKSSGRQASLKQSTENGGIAVGNDLEKGTTYHEGDQVNAANLTAHVDNATIKYTAIISKALKDP
jgi:hypothetical protein